MAQVEYEEFGADVEYAKTIFAEFDQLRKEDGFTGLIWRRSFVLKRTEINLP